MAKQLVDGELDIKRKARRRLVGSFALTLVVVATLPMVLDNEPKTNAYDIELKIPDPAKVPPLKPLAAIPEAEPASSVPAIAAVAVVNRAQTGQIKPATPVEPVNPPPLEPVKPEPTKPELVKPEPVKVEKPVKSVEVHKPATQPAPEAKTVAKEVVVKENKPAPKEINKPVEPKTVEPSKVVERKEPPKPEAKPAEPKEPVKENKPAAENFVVQIGAFGNPETARQEVVKLQGLGFKAYTEKVGNMVRVRVGPYHDKGKAEDAQGVLQHHGVSSSVMKAK